MGSAAVYHQSNLIVMYGNNKRMIVKQIPVNNSLRNYMYLIACPETLEAVAIDPLDHALCLATSEALGWTIRGVINTHEHFDHIGGNEEVIGATGATLYAHHMAVSQIPNVDVGLKAGDSVQVGSTVRLLALDHARAYVFVIPAYTLKEVTPMRRHSFVAIHYLMQVWEIATMAVIQKRCIRPLLSKFTLYLM